MTTYWYNRAVSARRILQGAFVVCSMAALGCQRSTTPGDDPVALVNVLPTEASYITGIITQRDSANLGSLRVLVERTAGDRASGALVSLPYDLPVYWRNGRRGTVRDLQIGRTVTAWVGPTELRSLPPQVFAILIVVER